MEQNRREFLTGAAWMGAAAKPFAVDEIDISKFDFSKIVANDKSAQKI